MRLPSVPQFKKYVSGKHLMFFWYRHYKAFFFLGFLLVLGYGGTVWYGNLYQYQWSPETKKAYLEQHFKETVFKERAFLEAVKGLQSRSEEHEEKPKLVRNVFTGTELE